MSGHPTVDVVIDGTPTPIDVDIAPLVNLINRAGVRTTESCQEADEHQRASISFESAEAAATFLNVVAAEPGTHLTGLWNRITDIDEPEDFDPWQIWSYHAGPYDRAMTWAYDGRTYTAIRQGPPNFDFGVTTVFPRSDLPTLVELMRQHLHREPTS